MRPQPSDLTMFLLSPTSSADQITPLKGLVGPPSRRSDFYSCDQDEAVIQAKDRIDRALGRAFLYSGWRVRQMCRDSPRWLPLYATNDVRIPIPEMEKPKTEPSQRLPSPSLHRSGKGTSGSCCGWRIVTCQFRDNKVFMHHNGNIATMKRKAFKELVAAVRVARPKRRRPSLRLVVSNRMPSIVNATAA
jgi:hypothetical protein